MLTLATRTRVLSKLIRRSSFWADVPRGPPDPVFGVVEAFRADTNPKKVNLSVGAYRTDEGKPWVLNSVIKAEKTLLSEGLNKEYAPIAGIQSFCDAAAKLAFGADSPVIRNGKNATIQSLSGTGALKVGAVFIRRFFPGVREVFLPAPTWPNHNNVFENSDLAINTYRYYCPSTRGFAEKEMLADIEAMPSQSVILLHACAHNPTGVDPKKEQWKKISDAIKRKNILPFFDMAYQGFASGSLDNDAYAVRLFAEEGHNLMLAQSFAKNMGLYGERVGALTIVCDDSSQVKIAISQLKRIIRSIYSNPPLHGARIVEKILSTPELEAEWHEELKVMSGRILDMRRLLVENLKKAGSKHSWDHVTDQIGMFCYTGLTYTQVNKLIKQFSIYLTQDGRISIPGLTTKNNSYVADAIHTVTSA